MKVYINEALNSIRVMDFNKDTLRKLISVISSVLDIVDTTDFEIDLANNDFKKDGIEQVRLLKTGGLDMHSLEIILGVEMERLPVEALPDDDDIPF